MVSPQVKRETVDYLIKNKNLRAQRAYRLVGLSNSTYYYKSYCDRSDDEVKNKLLQLSQVRIRWGYPRLLNLLRRAGFNDNHKRVHRIYCELNLQLNKRPKKKIQRHLRLVLPLVDKPNQIWSMDFVSDEFGDGRKFRCFNLVDDFTHESLLMEADRSLKSEKLVHFFNKLKTKRKLPEMIVCDNGPEFISQNLDIWAYQNKVQLKFIQPGKPTQNAFVESFNGKFRDECLNMHWFISLEHARYEIEQWRKDYNENRPHRSLKMKTPNEFAKDYEKMLLS